MIEIERKFLVTSAAFLKEAKNSTTIRQGYLTKDPQRTVRVRITGKKGFITIKGVSDEQGLSRFEWEKEITLADANALMQLALPTVIEKTRYFISHGKHCFEVDVFSGRHQGLVLCEVELNTKEEHIDLPSWIGKEVTGDPAYYNSALSTAQ